MKKLSALLLATLVCGVAYAVSIEFTTYSATTIGDLKTTVSDDGVTTSTRIEFSGSGLVPLMKFLPEVVDENGPVKHMRMFNITNAGQPGVTDEATTSIYIECESDNAVGAKCNITIIKGAIPG